MSRPMRRLFGRSTTPQRGANRYRRLRLEPLETRTLLALTIDVGDHFLLPDTPAQTIAIYVSGGDAVEGLNFNAQVADGGPELGGSVDGPAITAVDLTTGAIFGGNSSGPQNILQLLGLNYPQAAVYTVTTASGTVAADGLLATLTIDTTGFASGSTFDLKLAGTFNGDTDFAGIPIAITNGHITLNAAPVAADDSLTVAEDGSRSDAVAATDADAGDTLTYRIETGPVHGTITSFNTNTGAFTYEPDANYRGADSFTFIANDGKVDGNEGTVSITVTEVNDTPARTAGTVANLTVAEDSGTTSLGLGSIAYSPGGGSDESGQTLTYRVTAVPGAGVGSIVLADGTTAVTAGTTYTLTQIRGMQFKTVSNLNGSGTFTFTVTDNGTTNGAADPKTLTQSLTVTVTTVNDTPARTAGTVANLTVAEDSGTTSLGLGSVAYSPGGGTDESSQTLTYRVTAVPGAGIGSIVLADGTTAVTAGTTYTLAQIRGMQFKTAPDATGSGTFTFTVTDNGTTAGAADPKTLTQSLTITVTGTADVVGRHIFYNNSAFDGNDAAANAQDDAAMPSSTEKQALLPGETATFANYTSYSRGINGIMVDIQGLADPGELGAADFLFRVGNDGDPNTWAAGPAPLSVSVRAGAGVAGSHRVTLIWQDNAIENQWLQVTVLATDNTGLPQGGADVFYFGNAIGESGNSATDAKVDATDEIAARNHPHILVAPASVDDAYDYNRDKLVNATDEILARNNQTVAGTALELIAAPELPIAPLSSAEVFAPEDFRASGESVGLAFAADAPAEEGLGSGTVLAVFLADGSDRQSDPVEENRAAESAWDAEPADWAALERFSGRRSRDGDIFHDDEHIFHSEASRTTELQEVAAWIEIERLRLRPLQPAMRRAAIEAVDLFFMDYAR